MPDDGRDYPRFFADFSWASAAQEPWTRPVQISSTRGLADIQSVVDVFELELDLFEWKSAIAEDNRYDLCTAGWSQEVMDVLHEPDSRWEDFYADVLRISSDPRVRWLDEPFGNDGCGTLSCSSFRLRPVVKHISGPLCGSYSCVNGCHVVQWDDLEGPLVRQELSQDFSDIDAARVLLQVLAVILSR